MASLVKTVPAGSARGDAPAGQRSMYLFKASVRVSAENIVEGAKEYEYAQGHAFVNNLRRYYNPFVLGPRIEMYSKKNNKAMGILFVRGVPRKAVANDFTSQECVLLRPSGETWEPAEDNLDYGIYLRAYQVEIEDWYIYEKTMTSSEATLTTYNVAHLLGERKNMGHPNNKELACFSTNPNTKRLFYKFHATALYNMQCDVIMMQEMPGVYHNKEFVDEHILKPIVAEMNRMLAEEYTRQRNFREENKNDLMYKYVSLCNDNRYWHSYGIISRLPLTNFTQETPVCCQGMCGVTLQLLNNKRVRLYTSHLHYQPCIQRYQLDEVHHHLAFIKNEAIESRKTKENTYDYIIWGGDFNNQSMMSYNMQLVINLGGFTPLPYFYVDTFFVHDVATMLSQQGNVTNANSDKTTDTVDKGNVLGNYHFLEIGDCVLARFPNYRGRKDHPYFAGIIQSFELHEAKKITCSVKYNDGDVASGVEIDEVYYAPNFTHKDVGNDTKHRFNSIEDVLCSYNTCFKVYHVFNCSNNFEINRNDYRWRWHDSHRFNACKGQQKLPASDKFNISYFGPIANYQTHQRYQSRGDALYGDGVHSDHLPVCIKISVS